MSKEDEATNWTKIQFAQTIQELLRKDKEIISTSNSTIYLGMEVGRFEDSTLDRSRANIWGNSDPYYVLQTRYRTYSCRKRAFQ